MTKKTKITVGIGIVLATVIGGIFLLSSLKDNKFMDSRDNFLNKGPNETIQTKSPEDVCLTNEEYAKASDSKAPVLTMPFDMDDFSSKFWGVVPFCADQWEIGRLHNAIDFEVKPDTKIYAAVDGEVLFVKAGEDEGAGDVIDVKRGNFKIDYAGLTNVQVKNGDQINRGDYLGDAAITPYGEYHLHLGISTNGNFQCPIKYMDQNFKEAVRLMFAQSHYPSQSTFPCACNCEYLPSYEIIYPND